MIRLITALLLLIAAVSAVSAAAQRRDIPHFPLQRGNSWEFTFSYEIGPGFYPPTDTLVVKDVLGVDDPSTYFIVDPIPGIPDTLRTDGTQRVFAVRFGLDYLHFDFRAPDSSMYRIPPFSSTEDSAMVFVRHGYVVETPAGTFEDCIRFAVDYVPSVTDDEAFFYFAPEVGLVKYASGWALAHLSRATIHGKTITRAERPAPRSLRRYRSSPTLCRHRLQLKSLPVNRVVYGSAYLTRWDENAAPSSMALPRPASGACVCRLMVCRRASTCWCSRQQRAGWRPLWLLSGDAAG